jgi:two-component system NtrC family sensor kinase
MQLRHKFFLVLTILTALPLLILLFGVVDRMESEISTRTEKELHVTLDKMADEINLILENQKSIARGLVHVPAVKQFAAIVNKPVGKEVAPEEYQQRADELEQFFLNYAGAVPSIQAIRFIDPYGKTLVKVKEGKTIEPKQEDLEFKRLFIADQSNKNFFKYTLNTQSDIVMSDFELGQVTGDADFCPAMVRYSAQVKDEIDRFEGLLVVNMWGTRVDSTVEASLGGYPGKAFIVELNSGSPRDGIYLYHRDARKRFADQLNSEYRFSNEINDTEWSHILKTRQRGSLFRDDGRMLFYRSLNPFPTRPDTTWLLVVEADRNTVFAAVENMRKSIWLLLGLLLVISLLLSVWAAWQLARPVHDLAEVITRYADGDQQSRYIDQRKDEIGIAGKAFNYLVSSLQKAKHDRDKAEQVARQSERLASVGQLAAGIGHEINNPLMNIMSLAALVEQNVKGDEEALNDLKLLQKEGQRCARIVQGILSFARENKPDFREFDISQLVDDTLQLLQHRLESAEISVVTDLKHELFMTGDSNQLQQVLVNIILNAVQASPAGSTIHIRTSHDIDCVLVEIVDAGAGIRGENLNKVFDPFFTTKSEGEGTGLGLSVSYGIVKRHGGTIHLENNEETGLRVVIMLPFEAKEQADSDSDEEPEVMHAI